MNSVSHRTHAYCTQQLTDRIRVVAVAAAAAAIIAYFHSIKVWRSKSVVRFSRKILIKRT